MQTHLPDTLRRARMLRRTMSLPEVLLWRELKARPANLKFRKQHPFGQLVADFYCDAAKLAIEVDGEVHNRGDQPEFDAKRDAWFAAHGSRVLRIPAREVLSDLDSVVRHIIAAALAASPPPSALRAATSPKGGGFLLER